jgi:hypothetical protein
MYEYEWKTKWKTKDGQIVYISKMSDEHLVNTIKYLRRIAPAVKDMLYSHMCFAESMCNGEMALASIDDNMQSLSQMSDEEILDEYYPAYDTMIDEANKRKLEV